MYVDVKLFLLTNCNLIGDDNSKIREGDKLGFSCIPRYEREEICLLKVKDLQN